MNTRKFSLLSSIFQHKKNYFNTCQLQQKEVMSMIYFDNAATSLLKPDCVAEAVYHAIKELGNSNRGVHESTLNASRLLFHARSILSDFFDGYGPEQTVFTSNITESLNTVIQGLFNNGDHVITTAMEHNSVLRPLYFMENQGVSISIVNCNKEGVLEYDSLEKLIQPNTKAVICNHASNLTGNLIDLDKITSICKKHNLLCILDTAQTAGVFPISMKKQGIDILCFTGHKGLFGPQGIGGLLLRDRIQITPLKYGGTGISTYLKGQPNQMPESLEAGTVNTHGVAGLISGIEYINKTGLESIRNKELALMWKFYDGIKNLPNVKIYGDFQTKMRAAIVALNIGDYDSGFISDQLAYEYDICTRSGGHCAPLMHTALNTIEQGAVRFSFSHLNKEEEVDLAIRAITQLALLDQQ